MQLIPYGAVRVGQNFVIHLDVKNIPKGKYNLLYLRKHHKDTFGKMMVSDSFLTSLSVATKSLTMKKKCPFLYKTCCCCEVQPAGADMKKPALSE